MTGSIDLNGIWKLRWSDGQRGRLEHALRDPVDSERWLDAQVPGEVHLDLLRAGIIADPYVGTNVLSARWVEEFQWSYRRSFELEQVPAGRAWLVFEGLDLNAVILLNGEEVGRHGNFFRPCRIEVTGKLRAGENTIIVHLDSGLWGVADKPSRGYEHWPDQTLNKRHWLRKPQCQFGWDWAQRLINVGIHGAVRLEWSDDPIRVDQITPLVELNEALDRGKVRVRVFADCFAPCNARLMVEIAGIKQAKQIDLVPGAAIMEADIEVEQPQLWWPIGLGEQHRYALRVTVDIAGHIVGRREFEVGFRHVRVDHSPHPAGGRYFTFVINGRKTFARGANFVPADMIFARIDRLRYEKLIELAVEQNFNFLRVWGGGLYESDDFYRLCDERGILVWQEFIFACSRYPTTDETFFNEVKAEATHQIRRLAPHPSLIAWCGNNEIEWGVWDWDYGSRGVIAPDHALFHVALPRLLRAQDPTRYYQPSSPLSPDGLAPNAPEAGDQHPWSVGFFNYDIRDYRKMIGRFANEGGVLGPTSLPTMKACLGQQQKVNSFAFQIHDNSVAAWTNPSAPDEFLRRFVGKEPRDLSIEQFTYWAGLLQGEGLKEYIENFRRRMFDSSAAVFWMMNDCWPATRSWTTVDYHLRRAPAFHAVRRAMAPVHVVLVQEDEQTVIYGINDTPAVVEAQLSFGEEPTQFRQSVALPANASTRLASFKSQAPLLYAILSAGDKLLARNRLIVPMFRDLTWQSAQVSQEVKSGMAAFRSATFAWGVCLDLDGERPLADNFFDLYPGIPYEIPWPHERSPEVLFVGNLHLR